MAQRTMKEPPLILLSGMGADARVFESQRARIPRTIIPSWIRPLAREPLSAYAERFARTLASHAPCFIGGASFGGFVALEMMRHLDTLGCFLVGSVRSSNQLPPTIRSLRGVAAAARGFPFEITQPLGSLLLWSSRRQPDTHWKALLKQAVTSKAPFLRWACEAVLRWNGPGPTGPAPIFHIHGSRDIVLPVKYVTPDRVVDGAGHALSLSHPDTVTDFIKEKMKDAMTGRTHHSRKS